MSIFKEIEQSIYGPEYYDRVLREPFSFSLRYYISFALTISLLATIVVSLVFVPRLNTLVNKIGVELKGNYPEELEVNIREGVANANVKQPYYLPYPATIPQDIRASFGTSTKNFVAIDTKTELGVEQFSQYESAVLLTKDKVIYRIGTDKIETQSLKQLPAMTITKGSLSSFVDSTRSLMKIIAPLLVLIVFVLFMVVLGFNLVYLLLAALLIWLVVKARGYKLGYWKSYQVGMHAITASIIVDYLTFLLLPLPGLFLVPTLVMLLIVIINLKPNQPPMAESTPEA